MLRLLKNGIVADVDADRVTSKPTAYIDIKSDSLQDVLRNVLKHIKWIGLGGDKPSVYASVHDQSIGNVFGLTNTQG